jgi:hypothetical protein
MFKKVSWYNSPDLKLFLQDPISAGTRRERTCLLLAATVGIFFAHTGLVPQEISVLGIKFAAKERLAWWLILALIVFYFLFAFGLYCVTDYVSWLRTARDDLFRQEYARLSPPHTAPTKPTLGTHAAVAEKVGDQYATPRFLIESRLWNIRCAFDLLLPVAIGIYAMAALLLSAFW